MKYDDKFIEMCIKAGKHIQKLREERNVSLKELSIKTKIRIQYLKKIEEGKAYGMLVDKHLIAIANGIGVNIHELFLFDIQK